MSQVNGGGGGSGGAGVTSVTGTANQVTASPTTGAVIVSTPSTFIAPGSIESTTTLKADGIFTASSGQVVNVTTPGAYPYTTLTSDYDILVDTTSARTINLEAAPTTGQTHYIKDNTGSAATNNITIVPAAGNIDGAANYKITNNYGSVELIYNGTQWNVVAFGGGVGTVNSVTGTANQVTVTPTTGAVVVSTPSTFIAPGSIASTTTITSGTSMASTTTLTAGGQFLSSDGTNAAPGISFTSRPGYGFALSGSSMALWDATSPIFSATLSDFQIFANLSTNSAAFLNRAICASVTTPGAYPYTTVFNDFCVLVDTSSARTINLFAGPVQGELLTIKDNVGSAGANVITIQGNGKNIDGAGSTTITTNYGCMQFIYNGTQWNVISIS